MRAAISRRTLMAMCSHVSATRCSGCRHRVALRLVLLAVFVSAACAGRSWAGTDPTPSSGDSTLDSSRPPPASTLWLVLAAGPTTLGGAGGALAISYQRAHIVGSLRASFADDGQPSEDWGPSTGDFGAIVSYGTLVGSQLRVSAGAGVGSATYNGKDSSSSGFSIPLEFQATWLATRGIGLGLYGWANSRGPFAGLGLALNVGRLR
jgi:hypothetical protein